MRRLVVAGLAALTITVSAGPAVSASDADYIVGGGKHTAERAEDGTTTLKLDITNLGDRELELRLDGGSVRCADVTGKPTLQPYTSGELTFTMVCEPGSEPRSATVTPTAAGLSPAQVPVEFTVKAASESDWAVLWWFLLGAPVAAASVLLAYWFWFIHPTGNRRNRRSGDRDPSDVTVAMKTRLEQAWLARHPLTRLPSLTDVWDFKNDWSSNVGLAAALFTAVLANTTNLEAVIGEDATGPLSVVTAAAALSAALIGTGPLWLVICRRRYDDDPAASDHTVGGVLVASFVVLWGTTGLILAVAALLDLWQAWALAAVAGGVLLTYAAKSVPMTLAKGLVTKKPGVAAETSVLVKASGML